jgi:hypothetical protein
VKVLERITKYYYAAKDIIENVFIYIKKDSTFKAVISSKEFSST